MEIMTAFLHAKMRKRCLRLYNQAQVHLGNGQHALLVQPLTYVNRSGEILNYFIPRRFSADQFIVILDNLDLPPGIIRVRKGGSSAGHNGLKSIISHLGTADFIRIYIGIGRPVPGTTVVDHVLSAPEDQKQKELLQQGIVAAAEATLMLCRGASVEEVAREYHRRSSD